MSHLPDLRLEAATELLPGEDAGGLGVFVAGLPGGAVIEMDLIARARK